MDKQSKLEIKVGVVSVAAIILFVIGITLGKGINVGVNQKTIKLRFATSGGIQPSAPIVVNGVKRGEVVGIKNDNSSVVITGQIDDQGDLRKDATALITILELTGGKKIEINPGKSTEPMNLYNEIPGTTPPDLSDMIVIAGSLTTDAKVLISKLDTALLHVNALLGDPKINSQIRSTLDNTAELTRNLSLAVSSNLAKVNSIVENMKVLTQQLKTAVDENSPRISSILQGVDNAVPKANELVARADSALRNADQLIGQMKKYMGKVENSDGLVSLILFDKKFAAKVDSTVTALQKMVDEISKHGLNTNVRLGTYP